MEESKMIDQILEILTQDQSALKSEIEESVSENRETSEPMALYGLFRAFVSHPEKTNWKALMANIERILNSPAMAEHAVLVEQYILEGFSNTISNKAFDAKFLKDSIGPKAKTYIEAYEKFMGGTRTF
ncbi:hypothetical protein D3C87_1515250 [compost metagenome]